jgi:hypothetical protein
VKKVPSFQEMMSPKQLPKMKIKLPEIASSQTVQMIANPLREATSSEVVVEVPTNEEKKD